MAALRLSDADRIRRDKIAGLLGSAHDGERLAALAMLQKMANTYKVRIDELLLSVGNDTAGTVFDQQRAEQAERRAREAELRAQRAEQAAREARHARPAEPDPIAPQLPADWRDRFTETQQLNGSRCFLTSWEANFVSDLIARGTRWPSPKQSVIIIRILEKTALLGVRATSGDDDWEDVEE